MAEGGRRPSDRPVKGDVVGGHEIAVKDRPVEAIPRPYFCTNCGKSGDMTTLE
jgi:hypothetical protein